MRFEPPLPLLGAELGLRADRHLRILVLAHGLIVEPHFRRGLQFAGRDDGVESQAGGVGRWAFAVPTVSNSGKANAMTSRFMDIPPIMRASDSGATRPL